uniref:Uncharacterized protein n=1 Tax=Arundo donax TaxID=35708 RepID=A0A0A9GKB3_ARUDO
MTISSHASLFQCFLDTDRGVEIQLGFRFPIWQKMIEKKEMILGHGHGCWNQSDQVSSAANSFLTRLSRNH